MTSNLTVAVVDDDSTIRETLMDFIETKGYDVRPFKSGEDFIDFLNSGGAVNIVLTDLILPGMSGLDLLKIIEDDYYHIEVILITGHATVDNAVEAIRKGARSYLEKPIDSKRLEAELESAASVSLIYKDNIMLSRKLKEKKAFQRMLGNSRVMQDIKNMISQVAPTDVTVLITGESGTGKELVADAVQQISKRVHENYIKVNLGALPKELLESELFGHEKGAFTGAVEQRKGRFELAHKGVIFLDEIGELSLSGQVKLLRVLETGDFERVGGQKSLKVDVRVIAATNNDLEESVKKGEFREDLFYRLNVFRITVPPLRERIEDIPLITFGYLNLMKEKYGIEKGISEEAVKVLQSYSWPGNVRELTNILERSAIMSRNEVIRPDDIPPEMTAGYSARGKALSSSLAGMTMDEIEKQAILQTLEQTGGNKKKCAETLRIGLKTLYRKLGKYEEEKN